MLRSHLAFLLLISALAMFFANACAPTATPTPIAKLSVIATTTQLEDVVSQVTGDRVTVIGLVPRNGDPHELEPTPADVRNVANAQAVFVNGAGLEGWLDELIKNAGGTRPIFDTTQGLALHTIDRAFEEGGETDPHVWMSPVLMQGVVNNIVVGLKQIDPQNSAMYDANAKAYQEKLRELDAWAQQQIATIPLAQRQLVTAHDALGYFATRYGFEIVGYVIPSVSTEGSGASAQQLAELEDQIKRAGVKIIFAERSANLKFIDQIAADTHVEVGELYVDSLGDKGGEAGTYLDFFRTDVTRIVKGLMKNDH